MNGRQLAEEARKRTSNLRVFFTTAYARNAIVHDGRLDPGVALLPKPYTQSALATKVRDILDARQSPGRILIVEDEVLIQILAIDYLEEAGFNVDAAGSASEAMNKLALIPGGVDAAIVDMGLPDRKGDVLIQEMRTMHPSLPVVVATGQGAESCETRSKACTTLLSCRSHTLRPAFLVRCARWVFIPISPILSPIKLAKMPDVSPRKRVACLSRRCES